MAKSSQDAFNKYSYVRARAQEGCAYLDHKPSAKANTTNFLRSIVKAGAERENGRKTGKESRGESKHRARDANEWTHASTTWVSCMPILKYCASLRVRGRNGSTLVLCRAIMGLWRKLLRYKSLSRRKCLGFVRTNVQHIQSVSCLRGCPKV
jgi:hypothetical protein